jgi:hypothetical protein
MSREDDAPSAFLRITSSPSLWETVRALSPATRLPPRDLQRAIKDKAAIELPADYLRNGVLSHDEVARLLEILREDGSEAEIVFKGEVVCTTKSELVDVCGHDHDERTIPAEACPKDKDKWMETLGRMRITKREEDQKKPPGGGDWSSIRSFTDCGEVADILIWRQEERATVSWYGHGIRVHKDWGSDSAMIEYYRTGDSEWQEHFQYRSD